MRVVSRFIDVYPPICGSKVLVVGGCGFIGQALVKRLITLGADVVSLNRQEKKDRESIKGVTEVVADLRDHTSLKKKLDGRSFDYVFNLGGYIDHSPYLNGGRMVIDTHYVGTLNLLDQVYSPSLKAFIQIGSSDEYGNVPAPQTEKVREAPIAPYSAAKVAATYLIQTLARTENFPGVVIRLFLVYGPGQDEGRFLPQIIKGCLRNESFKTSKGAQLRDFCYIEDAIDGMVNAALSPSAIGSVINIASGAAISIREIIDKVVDLTGGGKPLWGTHPYRKGENMELYADISLAKSLLQWKPETKLEEGLKKTVDYYRNSVSRG